MNKKMIENTVERLLDVIPVASTDSELLLGYVIDNLNRKIKLMA